MDPRGRRRGAAPLPAGLGALAALAPRADVVGGRRGPGGHAGRSSARGSSTGVPTSWPDPLAFRPERFLDASAAPHGLPAVRPGAAAVHRPRVRARRDGRRAEPAARDAPRRRAGRGWTRPAARGPGRRAPAWRHAARRHPPGRDAVTTAPSSTSHSWCCSWPRSWRRGWLLRDLRTLPRGRLRAGPVAASVSVVVPARDEEQTLPALLRSLPRSCAVRSARSSSSTTAPATRPPRWREPPAPAWCRPATRPPGWTGKAWACHVGAAADDRRPAALPRRRHGAGAGRPATACSPLHDAARRAGVGAAATTRVVRPYEQLSAYFNAVALMASAAFTRRRRRRPADGVRAVPADLARRLRARGRARGRPRRDPRRRRARRRLRPRRAAGARARSAATPCGCAAIPAASASSWPGGPRTSPPARRPRRPAPPLATVAWISAHHAVAVGAVLLAPRALAGVGRVAGRRQPPALGGRLGRRGAWQLRWRAAPRRDSFRWWTWALFPVPLLAFDLVFARSLAAHRRPPLGARGAAATSPCDRQPVRGRRWPDAPTRHAADPHHRRRRRRVGRLPRRHGLRRPPPRRRAAGRATAGCCGSGPSRTAAAGTAAGCGSTAGRTGCPRRAPCSRAASASASCPALDVDGLELFVRETRRAELAHWWAMCVRPALRALEPARWPRRCSSPTACWSTCRSSSSSATTGSGPRPCSSASHAAGARRDQPPRPHGPARAPPRRRPGRGRGPPASPATARSRSC